MSIETALKDAEDEIRSILKDIGNHVHAPKRLVSVFHKLWVELHLAHQTPTSPPVAAAATETPAASETSDHTTPTP